MRKIHHQKVELSGFWMVYDTPYLHIIIVANVIAENWIWNAEDIGRKISSVEIRLYRVYFFHAYFHYVGSQSHQRTNNIMERIRILTIWLTRLTWACLCFVKKIFMGWAIKIVLSVIEWYIWSCFVGILFLCENEGRWVFIGKRSVKLIIRLCL